MHTCFPFASHCVLGGCAALICKHPSVCTWSLSRCIVVQGSGPVVCTIYCWFTGMGSNPGPIFLAFFVTCLAEKIGFPCTNKACQKKRNSHRLPICIFPLAAVEDSATDAESSTTPDSTDSVAKDVAAPDTTRGAKGTCSPESNDWGADDEVLEGRRLKKALGRAERTHKLQPAP